MIGMTMIGITNEDRQAEREAMAIKHSFRSSYPRGSRTSRGHGKRQLADPGAKLKDRRGAHLPKPKPAIQMPDFARRILNGLSGVK